MDNCIENEGGSGSVSRGGHPGGAVRGKVFLIRAAECCLTVLLHIFALWFLTRLLERKEARTKYEPFFAEEQDFDVLFLGSSHMLNAVLPMEMYSHDGIVSYNLAGSGNFLPTTYWVLENALDYTTPQAVVVDCYFLNKDYAIRNVSQNHVSFDAFPLSRNKIRAVRDLLSYDAPVEESEAAEAGNLTPLNFLWDYTVYHSRWSELNDGDFNVYITRELGAEPVFGVAVPAEHVQPGAAMAGVGYESTLGTEYLERLISDCRARGIKVLLTYLPFPENADDRSEAALAGCVAREQGVDFLDFYELSDVPGGNIVNFDTDCFDPDGHLNVSGARKVSKYLGKWLKTNFDIPDRRSDAAYASWNEAAENYRLLKVNTLKEKTELDTYLMTAADDDFEVLAEVGDKRVLEIPYYHRLLRNLGGITGNSVETVSGDGIHIMVVDTESGEDADDVIFTLKEPDEEEPIRQLVTESINR
ncbi:MAG: SGNH/GDSL hydrolase family protein [Eubacteriales bacterium]|nr:SGNH/GDSL hydrolase family protein [Eubacteriales bacterium]